jgi:hypothetical protein
MGSGDLNALEGVGMVEVKEKDHYEHAADLPEEKRRRIGEQMMESNGN